MISTKTKNRFLLSPYNFGLFIFMSLLYIGVMVFVLVDSGIKMGLDAGFAVLADLWILCILMLSAIFIAALLRESTGVITVTEEKLILRSFLRKTIRIPYESVSHVGIDFGVVNLRRQYYIYISKVPLPKKYWHNITQLKINDSTIKIAFRNEVFDLLVNTLP